MTYVLLTMLCVIVGLIAVLQVKCWMDRSNTWSERATDLQAKLHESRKTHDSADWWKEAE